MTAVRPARRGKSLVDTVEESEARDLYVDGRSELEGYIRPEPPPVLTRSEESLNHLGLFEVAVEKVELC